MMAFIILLRKLILESGRFLRRHPYCTVFETGVPFALPCTTGSFLWSIAATHVLSALSMTILTPQRGRSRHHDRAG